MFAGVGGAGFSGSDYGPGFRAGLGLGAGAGSFSGSGGGSIKVPSMSFY